MEDIVTSPFGLPSVTFCHNNRLGPTKDHVIAIIKAGLNAVPYVGDSIASLIGDHVPTSTERSIEKTMEPLGEKLASLKARIDV